MSKSLSDGQTKSLGTINIEKKVDIAIFAAASNMARTEERGTDRIEFMNGFMTDWERVTKRGDFTGNK